MDDDDAPTAPAPTPIASTPALPAPTASPRAVSAQPVPAPALPTTAGGLPPAPATAISSMPSALVPTQSLPATGFARLNLHVSDPGSIVYVFPQHEEPDEYAVESALMQCATTCSADLPLGNYSVRVVAADGARSYSEVELRSARWISVSAASQVTRDLGFATGVVGTTSTVLGVALLAEAICDTCTSTARDAGAAFALGLGIPMMAIGWSLYVIHRKATIDDRILTQAATDRHLRFSFAQLSRGGMFGAAIDF